MVHERRWAVAIAAVVGGVIMITLPRLTSLPQNPHGLGLGPYQSTPALTALGVALIAAALVAPRSPVVALSAFSVVTVLLGALVFVEFKPALAPLVLASLVPAILFVGRQRLDRRAFAAMAVGVLIGGACVVVARQNFASRYGPTHAESTAIKPTWHADWMWVGNVQPTSATITAGGLSDGSYLLRYWTSTEQDPREVLAVVDELGIARFDLDGLQPGTTYVYRIEHPDFSIRITDAAFRTPTSGARDITIVLGSCARTGSNGAVFDAMVDDDPDLFLALGDLHYANLVSSDPGDHLAALGRAVGSPAQARLFSSVPTAWVWDDHDFGNDDSDSSSPSRGAVSAAYRAAVPHYDVSPDLTSPINQAFTLGRVRIIVTDTRSMRTDDSMLGAEQVDWLVNELAEASRSHALVIWANPAPWIVPASPGTDQWGGYPDERQTIADAIAEAGIDNLVMVSGDFHMTAIDDGTNTDYSTDRSGGFPLLQAGPFDRPGAPGGGPYSHGTFAGSGQYGRLEISDSGGGTIEVTLSGHDSSGRTLTSLDLVLN